MISPTQFFQLKLSLFRISQRDLAASCGYSVEHLSRLLHNRRSLTVRTRKRLAEGFRDLVTPDNII